MDLFEWDEPKRLANIAKHGVDFSRASLIFRSAIIERVDDREDYGELRLIALGQVDGTVYRVIYTIRDNAVMRIISAQKAERHERDIYYRQIYS